MSDNQNQDKNGPSRGSESSNNASRISSHSATPGVSRPNNPGQAGEPTFTQSRLSRNLRKQRDAHKAEPHKRSERWGRILSVPLKYLSASTTMLLSLFMALGYLLTGQRDFVTVSVVFAILIMANGWNGLVRSPAKYPSAITTLVVGLLAVIAVRLTGDFAWATIVLGFTVAIAAIAEMMRPLPRENLVRSLSSSVFAGFVAIIGSAWIVLANSVLWAGIMTGAAVVVTFAVIGNQIGESAKANSIWALIFGAVSGLGLGGVAVQVGEGSRILRLAFPTLLGAIPPTVSVLVLSTIMGLAIGLIIALVDILFGEHTRRVSEAGAFARGAVKFMLVVMPIYVIVRVGALG